MSAQTPLPKDSPLLVAFNTYADTPEFANTARWAAYPEHVRGSLWAAFVEGWNARSAASSAPAPPIADDAALVETMAKAGAEAARKFNSAVTPWAEVTEYQRETLRRGHAATLSIARAHIERAARAKALDEASKVIDPGCKRPCGCDGCDCGDQDDAVAVAVWDSETENAKRILALKDKPPPAP